LIGCLIPRIRLHAKALRRRPPNAPRNLMRMTASTQWTTSESPEEFTTRAHAHLRRTRWRADLRAEADGVVTVASEKGYLRETGNLVFHVSLVALLVGIALGGLYGYKGTALLTRGQGFTNGLEAYDVFQPSKLFSSSQLAPFTFTLDHFDAKYTASGEPTDFNAYINYSGAPGQAAKPYDLRVNHPLDVDGAKVFLVGHGYALDLQVTNSNGKVVYQQDVPFLPDNTQFVSHGVVKVPYLGAGDGQLGLTGFFYPTAAVSGSGTQLTSSNPALQNPLLVLQAWKGDLGFKSGIPQSDYSLQVTNLKPIGAARQLQVGDTMTLPNGATVKVLGIHQWATFQIAHEPGKTTVLIAAILIIAGLLGSLRVRRRRFWVRAMPVVSADGTRSTVVTAAGLARTDVGGFVHELDDLAGELGRPTAGDVTEPPATERD
jgi:cytochrome c biogenesis protein